MFLGCSQPQQPCEHSSALPAKGCTVTVSPLWDRPAYPLNLLTEGKAVVITQSGVGLREPPCKEKADLVADLPAGT